MGVLAPVSAHAGHSARTPIDTIGNFPAHLSEESPSNISPSPSELISEVSELYDKPFLDIFEISLLSGQNRVNWGRKGGPSVDQSQGSKTGNQKPPDGHTGV